MVISCTHEHLIAVALISLHRYVDDHLNQHLLPTIRCGLNTNIAYYARQISTDHVVETDSYGSPLVPR